ncbi:hypothetical protein OUZ56_007735 [Daphnia magna]|uniref:Secreted protein n=1 Tax=Daphnia magna TaxID=35525 RepID=A0ABR0AAV0_9CRUS|nr:hypothetical protein OUZ56_007735 [Daphnia magna]
MLTIFNLTRGFLLRIPWISSIGLALHRFVGSVNVAIRLPLLIVDVWNSTSLLKLTTLDFKKPKGGVQCCQLAGIYPGFRDFGKAPGRNAGI